MIIIVFCVIMMLIYYELPQEKSNAKNILQILRVKPFIYHITIISLRSSAYLPEHCPLQNVWLHHYP